MFAERYAVVGVLSGRPVAFLQEWLPSSVLLSGLYGLEVVRAGVRDSGRVLSRRNVERWVSTLTRISAVHGRSPYFLSSLARRTL